ASITAPVLLDSVQDYAVEAQIQLVPTRTRALSPVFVSMLACRFHHGLIHDHGYRRSTGTCRSWSCLSASTVHRPSHHE
ncbi:MAG: hypothetical protein ACRDTJ_29030, partial [Pseudonocardiaceae bacterium]